MFGELLFRRGSEFNSAEAEGAIFEALLKVSGVNAEGRCDLEPLDTGNKARIGRDKVDSLEDGQCQLPRPITVDLNSWANHEKKCQTVMQKSKGKNTNYNELFLQLHQWKLRLRHNFRIIDKEFLLPFSKERRNSPHTVVCPKYLF